MKVLRWFLVLLVAVFSLLAIYVSYVVLRYPDLSVDDYKKHYQTNALQTLRVGDLEVYYQVEGQGPPLLLLHSHFFNLQMWDEWVRLLKGQFTLIRFDLPSHGLTGPDPSDDYSMERSQQIVEALLDKLKIQKAHLVGSSLGGNIAFNFAANHAERVHSLTLINSGGFRKKDSRGGQGKDLPTWLDGFLYLLPNYAYQAFLEWMIVDDSIVDEALVRQFVNSFRREGNRVAEMHRIRQFKRGNSEEVLGKITAPVHLLWGELNPQLPVSLVEKFMSNLTNAPLLRKTIYPDAGHVLPLEKPEESAIATKEFIQSLHIYADLQKIKEA